jgi:selenide, water dikinase
LTPALLSEILAKAPLTSAFPNLIVGTESCDDAAVYRLNDTQALVATTDFFMPIVDDPFDFGRIAATNAISDVYAMGGKPMMALALLGMPVGKVSVETIQRIVAGGQSVCEAAGIPIAGGHSIDSTEPIYGLVALGLVHPDRIKRNDRAQSGDVLILGKPLGVGIMSAALKKGELDANAYRQLIDSTTKLNTPGMRLGDLESVHAVTDVTGFGLIGHLMEVCRGAGLRATVRFADIPLLDAAVGLAEQGYATGASDRNWASCEASVGLPASAPLWHRKLLTDPQTSGGLLVACSPDAASSVLDIFFEEGFERASVIGRLESGEPGITIA